MAEKVQTKIVKLLSPFADSEVVSDVRIGLTYTGISLNNGNTAIAWTGHTNSSGCLHLPHSGPLAGKPAIDLLKMLEDKNNSLYRTIGLATANALSLSMEKPQTIEGEILSILNIQEDEKVVMVGFFGPMIPRIRKTNCSLDILELDTDKTDTIKITPQKDTQSLKECDVAIITATSIITDTIDDILNNLGNPRACVILGPSTIMIPEIFKNTKVTHLAGVRIKKAPEVMGTISEGGGTKRLKPFMDFETISMEKY